METSIDLAAVRKRRGRTQVDVAQQLGVSQSYVSQLERARDPRLSTLAGYVKALGGELEITAVFDGERAPIT